MTDQAKRSTADEDTAVEAFQRGDIDRGSPMPPTDPGAGRALVDAVRFFHGRGWCAATSSNFSYRAEDQDGFWISESGVDKGGFGPEHLMAVDLSGVPVPGETRPPSAETLLHAMVYRRRGDVRAVLHVHSPYAVVLSRAYLDEGAIHFIGWELQKGLAGVRSHETPVSVPIFPNSQDIAALAETVDASIEPAAAAFLLAGHGLYAFGTTVAEAKRHIEVIEVLLEQLYLWRTLK